MCDCTERLWLTIGDLATEVSTQTAEVNLETQRASPTAARVLDAMRRGKPVYMCGAASTSGSTGLISVTTQQGDTISDPIPVSGVAYYPCRVRFEATTIKVTRETAYPLYSVRLLVEVPCQEEDC